MIVVDLLQNIISPYVPILFFWLDSMVRGMWGDWKCHLGILQSKIPKRLSLSSMLENNHLGWCWVERFWPPLVMCFFVVFDCGYFGRMWTKGSRQGKMKENWRFSFAFSPNADIPNSLTFLDASSYYWCPSEASLISSWFLVSKFHWVLWFHTTFVPCFWGTPSSHGGFPPCVVGAWGCPLKLEIPGNFIDSFGQAECDVGLRGFARRSYDPKKWNGKASWSPTVRRGIERFWYGEDPFATWCFLLLKGWGCKDVCTSAVVAC